MDRRLQDLKRRAQSGDLQALDEYRRIIIYDQSLLPEPFPEPIIPILAAYGYKPAQDITPSYKRPNSTSQAFERLFHDIPHNAQTAAVIRYRVMAPAAERMIRRPEVIDVLSRLDTSKWDFQLGDRNPVDVIQNAVNLLRRMTQPDYYDELCIHSQRDYLQGQDRREPLGLHHPHDPLVVEHANAKKDCNAIGHMLQDQSTGPSPTSVPLISVPMHFSRAIFSLGDAIGPPYAGFEGVYNLEQNFHGLRYFLDGMDYSWSNQAHIDAIFSVYLI